MKKTKFIRLIGLSTVVLSQSIWAECTASRNTAIVITKPDAIYVDHLDGTVTDTETGLQWQKCSLGQTWNAGADALSGSDDSCDGTAATSTWQAALAQANDNAFLAKEWRLPNKNELKSLAEVACYNPAINVSLFPNVATSKDYWSASPDATAADAAWVVSFLSGGDITFIKSNKYYVRLVRSIQSL